MNAVVYWLLDADDNILYIGCTSQLRNRMVHHAHVQPWWHSVDSVAITDAMPLAAALQVESDDICTLGPMHNIQGKTLIGPQSIFVDESFDVDSFDIADHMTTVAAARVLGVDVATVNRWARRGDLHVALKMPSKVGANLFRIIDVERLAQDRATAKGPRIGRRITDLAS